MSNPDLIVIGGGPAGATAATIAAKAGLSVCLLEARRHPRPHVGESLLPGVIPILEALGIFEAVEREFTVKAGTTHVNWGTTPQWDLYFSDTDLYDHAWFVDRDRFDAMVFQAAVDAGTDVHVRAAVRELLWDGDRLVGVRYAEDGVEGVTEVRAPLVIDASGQTALVAKDLDLREPIPGLRHQAAWAHYAGSGHLPPPRERLGLFVAQPRQWLWHFPMGDHASVGVVRLDDRGGLSKEERNTDFEAAIAGCPEVREVLGPDARRMTEIHHERDWSYRMKRVAGPGWLLAGDASGFIDPILSQGLFLAMHAGFTAGRAAAELKDGADEATVLETYQGSHRELFDDLLQMVRFYYQQNLAKEDYFWESKRVLAEVAPDLKPQKAFLILTSGLVRNLAFEEKRRETETARAGLPEGQPVDTHDPDTLGFLAFHLRYHGDTPPAQLYLVVEPNDPAAPSLFRTRNFQINCLAPRYDNDPISVPALEPALRTLDARFRSLDQVPGEPLATFWRRTRGELVETLRQLPPTFELARIFGDG